MRPSAQERIERDLIARHTRQEDTGSGHVCVRDSEVQLPGWWVCAHCGRTHKADS